MCIKGTRNREVECVYIHALFIKCINVIGFEIFLYWR